MSGLANQLSITEVAAPVEKPQFYEWAFPGSPVRIRLKIDLVPTVFEHLNESFRHPQKPAEAGGFLIGTTKINQIEITGFEAFACEPKPDGSFIVAADARQPFRDAIERLTKSGSNVLGFCRSQLRDGLSLRKEDQSLMEEGFPSPANVFLVVNPGAPDWPTADFFFRDNGEFFAESIFPFPFDQQLLETEARAALHRAVAPPPEIEPEPAAPETAPPPPPRGSWKRRLLVFTTGLLITAAVLGVLTLQFLSKPPALVPPPPAPSRVYLMALSIKPVEDSLTINWDPASPAVKAARIGMLTIQDDARQEDIPLTGPMLQSGKFNYKPSGESVRVTMEVFAQDGSHTRETVSVLIMRTTAHETDLDAPSRRLSVTETTAEEPAHAPRPAPPRFELPRRKPQPDVIATIAQEPPRLLEDHSNIHFDPASTRLTAFKVDSLQAPAPPAVQNERPATVEVRPVAEPAKPTPAPMQLVSPKPLHQAKPVLTPGMRRMLQKEAVIQVKVHISEIGKVTDAKPLSTAGTIGAFLGVSAATAAHQWRFDPARLNGKPVSSELILEFRFLPETAAR